MYLCVHISWRQRKTKNLPFTDQDRCEMTEGPIEPRSPALLDRTKDQLQKEQEVHELQHSQLLSEFKQDLFRKIVEVLTRVPVFEAKKVIISICFLTLYLN